LWKAANFAIRFNSKIKGPKQRARSRNANSIPAANKTGFFSIA
jgi:hypothetical protein